MTLSLGLVFSSKSFMVSGLMFRSLIYCEFIFVYGVRKCSNHILLHVAVQFSRHQKTERLSFSTVYSCLLCCKVIDHKCMGFFLGSLFCSINLCVRFCASTKTAVLITVQLF